MNKNKELWIENVNLHSIISKIESVYGPGQSSGELNNGKLVEREKGGVSNIAHMANTPSAIDWAMKYGVNGVEVDLQYNEDQMPTEFHHGGPCDCTCRDLNVFKPENICTHLPDHCNAVTPIDELLKHVIQMNPQPSLFYFDNKVDAWEHKHYYQKKAGENLANLIIKFFIDGYRGKVVIGAGNVNFEKFLTAAKNQFQSAKIEDADKQKIESLVFYALDQEKNFDDALNVLHTLGTNTIYGDGISACSPINIAENKQIVAAVEAKNKGLIADVLIWTLDDMESLHVYIANEASMIMSNMPYMVNDAVEQLDGKKLRTYYD